MSKKIPPSLIASGGDFLFASSQLIFADNLDKAESVFDFADVQTFNEVVHFLRERTDFAVADNVILLLVAQDADGRNNRRRSATENFLKSAVFVRGDNFVD